MRRLIRVCTGCRSSSNFRHWLDCKQSTQNDPKTYPLTWQRLKMRPHSLTSVFMKKTLHPWVSHKCAQWRFRNRLRGGSLFCLKWAELVQISYIYIFLGIFGTWVHHSCYLEKIGFRLAGVCVCVAGGGGGGGGGGRGGGERMQPCKLKCCHMKSLSKTETQSFDLLFVFYVSKGKLYRLYWSNSSKGMVRC